MRSGIRVALGAQRRDALGVVIGRALAMAGAGAAGALSLSRVLSSIVFGVSARDPVTFASVTALLAGVAAIRESCAGPAGEPHRSGGGAALRINSDSCGAKRCDNGPL